MTISMPKPFLFFVIGYLPFAVAWRPIGHYAVARECGVTHEEAGMYNLPDAWNPYDWTASITDILALQEISWVAA